MKKSKSKTRFKDLKDVQMRMNDDGWIDFTDITSQFDTTFEELIAKPETQSFLDFVQHMHEPFNPRAHFKRSKGTLFIQPTIVPGFMACLDPKFGEYFDAWCKESMPPIAWDYTTSQFGDGLMLQITLRPVLGAHNVCHVYNDLLKVSNESNDKNWQAVQIQWKWQIPEGYECEDEEEDSI